MDLDIELYRGEDPQYFGEFEFALFLHKAALMHLGDLAGDEQIELIMEGPADSGTYPGPPEIRNLATEGGHCRLRLLRRGVAVHESRMRTVELLGPVLIDELTQLHPEESHWAFRLRRQTVRPEQLAAALIVVGGQLAQLIGGRPAPESQGSVDVDPGERRHQPFTLTPMARAEEKLVQPEDLGLDRDHLGKVNVLMPAEIHEQFLKTMQLSMQMEEGGFLLGRVTKADEDAHLVEITHITPAHQSGAGMVHFTFTGESFLAVAQLIEERGQSEELVGWYHTHLFGVAIDLGLSSIDVDLHLATFQRPWQVAALINIRRRDRLLRFYGRDEKQLREYDQWISDDSGKYRPASTALGGD